MKRIIISGGGTGGHIFPAISIADAIKRRWPDADILFVGAEDRMEMERVPAAGYKIEGLPVAGFDRKRILKNVKVLFKLFNSMSKARRIIKMFKPDIAIGVGGYASGPTLRVANSAGIPTLIQEQNSYAGVTNKLLSKKASSICVAYEGMERFFPSDKIVLTGNPCRQDLIISEENKKKGYSYFNLDENKRTILIVGGSLGAASINNSVINSLDKIRLIDDVQIIWQCGKYYYHDIIKLKYQGHIPENIKLMDFISRMDYAYSVADLIISRAGAGSISEFCLLGKAVILVPSPNVAEDHQTKNAMALVKKEAAIMVEDSDATNNLFDIALQLAKDDERLRILENNIVKLGVHDSAQKIVDEVEKIIGK